MKFHCDILLKSVFTWAAAHTQRSIDVCSGKPMLLTHTHTHTFQLTHCCEHTHIQHETHTHTHRVDYYIWAWIISKFNVC